MLEHGSERQRTSAARASPILYRLTGLRDYEGVISHSRSNPQDATWCDGNGDTTLHRACRCVDPPFEAVRAVISASPASASMQNTSGWTPLHFAEYNGTFSNDALLLLMATYPDAICVAECTGWTPFHFACKCGASVKVMTAMLSHYPALVARSTDVTLPMGADDDDAAMPIRILWDATTYQHTFGSLNRIMPPCSPLMPFTQPSRKITTYNTIKMPTKAELTKLLSKMYLLLRVSHYGTVLADPLPCRTWRVLHAACSLRIPRAFWRLVLTVHGNLDTVLVRDELSGNCALSVTTSDLAYSHRILCNHNHHHHHEEEDHDHHPTQQQKQQDIEQYVKFVIITLLSVSNGKGKKAASILNCKGRLPIHMALENQLTWNDGGIKELALAYPSSLRMMDGCTKLYPFMLAATTHRNSCRSAMERLTTIYELLLMSPDMVMPNNKNDKQSL